VQLLRTVPDQGGNWRGRSAWSLRPRCKSRPEAVHQWQQALKEWYGFDSTSPLQREHGEVTQEACQPDLICSLLRQQQGSPVAGFGFPVEPLLLVGLSNALEAVYQQRVFGPEHRLNELHIALPQ